MSTNPTATHAKKNEPQECNKFEICIESDVLGVEVSMLCVGLGPTFVVMDPVEQMGAASHE